MNTKTQEALKLALEALKECRCDPRLKYEHPNYDNIITALRRALAVSETHKQPAYRAVKTVHEGKAYYVSEPEQPAQQEPVAKVNDDGFIVETGLLISPGQLLYTSPPASKPWVGLTDEEMRDLEKQFNAERVRTSDEEYLIIYPGDYWAWQRAIEAKLREKNA